MTYSPGQGGGANRAAYEAGRGIGTLWAAIPAGLAAKAYKNHIEFSESVVEAGWAAAQAGRRWNSWINALIYTGFMMLVYPGLHVPFMWLILLVTYSRCIDVSLFKRNWLYKLTQPFQRFTDRIPNLVLYTGLILAPFIYAFVV